MKSSKSYSDQLFAALTPRLTAADESNARLQLADAARLESSGIGPLTGTLRGPTCEYAKTLPSTFRVAGPELLVTEPCYWSPAMPFLYELQVECELADGTSVTLSKTLGLRRLDVHRQSLRLLGRRTVLRGQAFSPSAGEFCDVAEAHELEQALLVANPNDEFLEQASRLGVAVIADLSTEPNPAARLVSLAWQPCVSLVVVSEPSEEDRAAAGDLSLWQRVSAGSLSEGWQPEAWSRGVVLGLPDATGDPFMPPAALAALPCPLIAVQPLPELCNALQVRQACDRLQAALAPTLDLAGYFVQ